MKGDFTRSTFNRNKHYSSVRMQQGRVQLDADWNEQVDIAKQRVETGTADFVGMCAGPTESAGFEIKAEGSDTIAILASRDQSGNLKTGRFYVDGILCEIEKNYSYSNQPDYPEPPEFTGNGFYLAYLDVWQRHITTVEDPELREVALGNADTATRTKTVWQVKLLGPFTAADKDKLCGDNPPDKWKNLIASRRARIAARVSGSTAIAADICSPSAALGFRRTQNQLYRVEIHSPFNTAPPTLATFKWSRDNGIVLHAIKEIDPIQGRIRLTEPNRDEELAFKAGQWVEILDDSHELGEGRGALVRLSNVSSEELLIFDPTTATATIPTGEGLKVRRWDQRDFAEITVNIGHGGAREVADPEGAWIHLEDGIEVQFADNFYQTGDYWLIPARVATNDIEWPHNEEGNPYFQERAGMQHHYCRLAVLELLDGNWTRVQDCRKLFSPLTGLCAEEVCFDAEHCAEEHPDAGWDEVENVQQALEQVCHQLRCPDFLNYLRADGIARNAEGAFGLEVSRASGGVLTIRYTAGIAYVGGCRFHVPEGELSVEASTTHQTVVVDDEGEVRCIISEFPPKYTVLAVVSTYEGEIKRIVDLRFDVSQLDQKVERNFRRIAARRPDRRQFVPLLAHSIKGLQYREGRNRTFDLSAITEGPVFNGVASGLATDGENIWVASNTDRMIAKIPREAGELSEIEVIELDDDALPYHTAAVVFDGRHLWFTLPRRDSVLRLDTHTQESLEIFVGLGVPSTPRNMRPTALAFDGDFLWVCNTSHQSVSMIDVETRQVLQVLALPHDPGQAIHPHAVAFDGSHVWVAAETNRLYKIEKPWGTPELVQAGPSDFPYAQGDMVFDGSHLWVAARNGALMKVDIDTHEIRTIVSSPQLNSALTFDGSHTWLAPSNSELQRIDAATNQIGLVECDFQNPPAAALFDGTHLWISAGTRIFKRLV